MTVRATDAVGGSLLVVLGAAIAIASRTTLALGTLDHMGPGFFPLCLGVVMAVLGAAIAMRPSRASAASAAAARIVPEWRGWLCIAGSVVAFIVVGAHLGLAPATFAIVFIAALGDRKNTWRDALVLSLGMVAIGVVVFAWLLQIQFPLVTLR